MAVLGGTSTTGRVAALLEVPVGEIRTAVAELAESGLIDGAGRTSAVVTGRVLGEMSEAEYRGLHARAAELLHHGGFPAVVVATHLLEAGGARGSWAARVLVAAADDALAGDELDRAGRCLDLAYRAARRADERAAIATRLVSVEWRINPSSRTRNFGRLKAALRTGRVPQADLPGTVLHMLWHGYGLHADHALTRLDRGVDTAEVVDVARHAARLDFLVSWLRYTHPGHAQRHAGLAAAAGDAAESTAVQQDSPHRQAGLLLAALCAPDSATADASAAAQDSCAASAGERGAASVLEKSEPLVSAPASGRISGTSGMESAGGQRLSCGAFEPGGIGGDRDEIAAGAQRLLARQRLTLTTVEPLVAAVDCLMYCDRLDTADAWCAALLAEATARRAPAWQSIFAAARAEALLRKGELVGAVEHAVLALNVLPAEQLGVWVGRPIAVLVLALTGQGKHAEAAAQLERPVPRAMFESRFALLYLTAHGRHCLATGRVEEALGHFRRCGRLMQEWGLDFAWLVPWRNELAAASLWAGRHWQAQTFATRHLDLIGRAEHHHTGAVSLRLLAATSEPHRRVPLLRRAVTIARSGVDRIELALVLADLGTAYRAVGDLDRARPLLREANRLANACDAAAVRKRLPTNSAQHRMPASHAPAAGGQAGVAGGRPAVPGGGRPGAAAGWPESAGGQASPAEGWSGGLGGSTGAVGGRPGVPDQPGAVAGWSEGPGSQASSTGGRSGGIDGGRGANDGQPGPPDGRTGATGGWPAATGAPPGSTGGVFGANPGSGFGSAPGDPPGKFPTGSLPLRSPAPAGDPLSPAERRVAELAALGNRNRDIAEALDITTSTVEQHLTRVYRKLAVSRRSELRFALLARTEGTTHTAVG
ncbi:LuxR C-terminal-related transcriptional regulator [Nocardia sp. NPDC088792]|uniref:LuxR C-terminal-related transcriptional regulator n=1 Tax=Nocardia sp. NPDC088792 TaxID=3364332 RepID=UPI0037F5D8AA